MDKLTILADEELIIRDVGEIPEVTFHSSLHYLTEDPEGPRITLDERDVRQLKKAVILAYQRIILRDIQPDNRDEGYYRGLERCRVNWQRLLRFCQCHDLSLDRSRSAVIAALKIFMAREVAEVSSGLRCSSVNCSSQALVTMLESLGLASEELPEGWHHICL